MTADRIPQMTSKEVASLLLKHGYRELRQKGSHRTFRHPDKPDPITLSMHSKDVKRPVLIRILKDIGWRP